MPDTIATATATVKADSNTVHPDVSAFLGTLPSDVQNHPIVQQLANSGVPLQVFMSGVQAVPEYVAFLSGAIPPQASSQSQNNNSGFAALTASADTEVKIPTAPAADHPTNVTDIASKQPLTAEDVAARVSAQIETPAASPVASGFTERVPAPRPITPEQAAIPDGTGPGLAKTA